MKIKEILRLPEKIPCDKRMHYLVGSVFASLLLCFSIDVMYISLATIVLAWGIEVSQKVFKWGSYDNFDALAVVVGGLVVVLPYIVMKGL